MKLFDRQIESAAGPAILYVWVIVACIVSNVWLSLTEPLNAVQAAANVILPLGVYVWLMSLSRHVGRSALWMITVMFFAAFQLVLLYMYGRSVIAVDMFLNVVTTNPDEVGELLGNMFPIMAAVVIIYLIPIIMAVVAVVRKWRLSPRFQQLGKRLSYWVMSVGAVCFVGSFFSRGGYNPLNDLFPVNAVYNVGLAVDRTIRLGDYPQSAEGYTFDAKTVRADSLPEIYVAIVGETSRAGNWQLLGYDRPTTPALTGREGLVAFPRALSQSNTTHKSVPMLLSALDATNFGDSIYHTKSLITAFKEAGFRTAFISNQNRNHSFIDRFGEEADTCIFIRDYASADERNHYDTNLLSYLDEQLAAGYRKLFVVLHTYGSHFSYIDRYPASEARFKPDGPAEAVYNYRREQLNAYDNTILLTSSLIGSVIDRLNERGAVSAMIYTSDHGEDIFDDDRRLFLHASPCPSYYQIHVPFLVWMSPEFIGLHPEMYDSARGNSDKFVASTDAYFHTLMELAGLDVKPYVAGRSVVSGAYAPSAPIYLNDHNQAVSLKEAGLLAPDFARLDSIGINVR